MPNYDVECSVCGHSSTEMIKLNDLPQWDATAQCPHCPAGMGQFKRVYKTAPACLVGDRLSSMTKASKQSVKDRFVTSGAKDDMRHKQEKRISPEQVAAAREGAAKGEFL